MPHPQKWQLNWEPLSITSSMKKTCCALCVTIAEPLMEKRKGTKDWKFLLYRWKEKTVPARFSLKPVNGPGIRFLSSDKNMAIAMPKPRALHPRGPLA